MHPDALAREILNRVKAREVQIPPYPAVGARLGALLATDRWTLTDVKNIVQVDQAIVADVLRVASSPAYAAATSTSLEAALARLGIEETRRIALARSVGAWSCKDGVLATVRQRVWRDSVMSALICQQLALKRKVDADAAFLAGLLHDFGKLVALVVAENILATSPGHGIVLDVARWLAIVEEAHVSAGVALAVKWRLPPVVVHAIDSHHDLVRCPAPMLVTVEIVRAADAVLALLAAKPAVDAVALEAVPELTREERDLVARLLPRLAELISSFERAPDVSALAAKGIVKPGASLLRTPRYPIRFPITRLIKDVEETLEALEIAPDGLAMRSAQDIGDNVLVKLMLHVQGQKFEIWGTACASQPLSGAHRIEVRCFAQSAGTRERWTRLFAAARSAAA